MKTILVPFDFSEYSLAALLTAKKIAAKAEAQLICVSVIPSEIDWDLENKYDIAFTKSLLKK